MALKLSLRNILKRFPPAQSSSCYSSAACLKVSEWDTAKPFSEIPSHKLLPLIGTAWIYMPLIGHYRLDQQHISDRQKQKNLGDIIREKVGNLDIVVCFRPDDLQEILNSEGPYPRRVEFTTIRAYRELRKQWYSTAGLLVIQGKEWHSLRSKNSKHLLRPRAVREYLDPVQDVAADLAKRIGYIRDERNEVPDLTRELYKWTLESVCLISLDTRLGCLSRNLRPDSDGARIIRSVLTQFECMVKMESFSGHVQFWKLFPTPTWRKLVKASDDYTEIAFKYINRALRSLESSAPDNPRLTLLQHMISTKDMDVRDVMVSIADFLMAGIETTAHSMGFLLYRLARDPDRQERVYQEIRRLMPSPNDRLTGDVLDNLKFLRACFKESLRLNPVVGGTARHLARDTVLSGYRVPAGTLATVPYLTLFRDERWFDRPDDFYPERWLNKDCTHHPFAYVPFGFGPRGCLGKRIAELEITCLLVEILRRYRLEYHHEDIGFKTYLVTIPDRPLKLSFVERNPTTS